ncbi:MAG: MaoC family dehydratase [Bacilli bacterium]|jgi:3-hydroxybutyryl-CoA dehydratase|nr:MaoC family dehydratase [Bacilli bacterium]
MSIKSYSIDMLSVGQIETFTKTITESDVYTFAGVSGDLNPAHINEEYAKNTMFKGRIAHGILGVSLISTVLGMYLPGPGTIFLGIDVKFVLPVRINDTITAEVEVAELKVEKNIVKLNVRAYNQENKNVIEGSATVMAPKKER